MNEPDEDVLERNIETLMRRGCLPPPEERLDAAAETFLSRLATGPSVRRRRLWGGILPMMTASFLFGLALWTVMRSPADVPPVPAAAPQDPEDSSIRSLILELSANDFEVQGKAAKALENLGTKALPALREALKGEDAGRRAWAEKIILRITHSDESIRRLIVHLASSDDEEKEAAEAELRAIGAGAVPRLAEAAQSESKNLRRRAQELLQEIRGASAESQQEKGFEEGGGSETEDAVTAALKWLARHQNANGSWGVQKYLGSCNRLPKFAAGGKCGPNPGQGDFDTGVTGLSLLAFLGAGYSHLSQDTYDGICFGDVVKKALQWLMNHQDPEGCIGPRTAQKYMYNHAVCALAMSEAYGLTGSKLFKDQAQKAIDFIIAAQNPGKGWRYSSRGGDSDTSVTGWAVMALKSAEISGLTFPRTGYDGARAWLDEVTEENYYRVGYTHKGTGKVFIPDLNENFNHHETLTAIAVLARIFMDKNKSDTRLQGGCSLLIKDKPVWKDNDIDFYYWYYASLALFQFDGPTGPYWKQWNGSMKDALVKHQNALSAGCRSGSWEPLDRWSCEGGRVYATAINVLTLEVYYRYARVFGAEENSKVEEKK